MRETLTKFKRIVIKVGTSTLTHKNGKLDFRKIEQLVFAMSELQKQGKQVVLVSSGAIAVGASAEGFEKRPDSIDEKQACAAIGQTGLMRIYEKFFEENNQKIGQILLTKEDIEIETRLKNARNTIKKLLEMKVIPVVNENDTISTYEIQFGDNDTLSAYVSKVVDAELLIILSDIDGLYSSDPKSDPGAKIIHQIDIITSDIENLGKGAGTAFGTGGMATKIEAAKICCDSGISMVIANGGNPGIMHDILEGKEIGTIFNFNKRKKEWIC